MKCWQYGRNYQEACWKHILQLPLETTCKGSSPKVLPLPPLLPFLLLRTQSFCKMSTLSCSLHTFGRGVISDLRNSSEYISFQIVFGFGDSLYQIWHSSKNCRNFIFQSFKVMMENLKLLGLFLVLPWESSLSEDLIVQPSEK